MKFAQLIAAAALALAGVAGTSTAASAAPVAGASAFVSVASAASVQDRRYRGDRRWDGNRQRWDRGRHHRARYSNRSRRVCWTEWRRHQGRVTICRRRR